MCMLSFQGFVFVCTRKYFSFLQSPTFSLHDHLKFLINTTHKFLLLLCTIMTKSLWLLKSDLYLTLDSKLEFYLHFLHFINNKKATYWSIDSWDWKTLLKTCPPGRKVCSGSDLVSAWGSQVGEQHEGLGQEDDQGGVGGAGCLRITYCNEIMPISPRRYEETVLDCIWPPDSWGKNNKRFHHSSKVSVIFDCGDTLLGEKNKTLIN